MRARACWTEAKDPACKNENADAFAYSRTARRFALSDGATQSYDAKGWAQLLCAKFVRNSRFSPSWLKQATTEYARSIDRDRLPWNHKAAYDNGSHATLLGLSLNLDRSIVQITAIGDSIAALIMDGSLVETYPYFTPDEFTRQPLLLATWNDLNTEFSHVKPAKLRRVWSLPTNRAVTLLGMTDALGAWLLSSPIDHTLRLCNLKYRRDFVALVNEERAYGRLKRDDTSLLIIR